MAEYLKRGATSEAKADSDRQVRDTVEGILADIEARGDAAVRELSVRFDGWDRDNYRLTTDEIQGCIDQLTGQDLKDIEFAQTQVRNFAQIQRNSMTDVEVETLPGVVLGHKHLPLNAAGCYVRTHVGHYGEGRRRAARRDVRATLPRQTGARDCCGAGDGRRG
jgi:sulfopropanediol 3-dehydrogenase